MWSLPPGLPDKERDSMRPADHKEAHLWHEVLSQLYRGRLSVCLSGAGRGGVRGLPEGQWVQKLGSCDTGARGAMRGDEQAEEPAGSPGRCQGETHHTEVIMWQGKEGRRTHDFNKQ